MVHATTGKKVSHSKQLSCVKRKEYEENKEDKTLQNKKTRYRGCECYADYLGLRSLKTRDKVHIKTGIWDSLFSVETLLVVGHNHKKNIENIIRFEG